MGCDVAGWGAKERWPEPPTAGGFFGPSTMKHLVKMGELDPKFSTTYDKAKAGFDACAAREWAPSNAEFERNDQRPLRREIKQDLANPIGLKHRERTAEACEKSWSAVAGALDAAIEARLEQRRHASASLR